MIIPNFRNPDGSWAKYEIVNRYTHWTKSGNVWNSLMQRTRPGSAAKRAAPHYAECSVAEEFKDFQFFAEWHMQQIGFGWPSYDLDKDILIPGNEIYTPDRCVLVPHSLNSFIFKKNADKPGGLPHGVFRQRNSKRFTAQITINNKTVGLGRHDTMEQAHQAFRDAKYKERDRWLERLEAGEFIVDPRVIVALRQWEF